MTIRFCEICIDNISEYCGACGYVGCDLCEVREAECVVHEEGGGVVSVCAPHARAYVIARKRSKRTYAAGSDLSLH